MFHLKRDCPIQWVEAAREAAKNPHVPLNNAVDPIVPAAAMPVHGSFIATDGEGNEYKFDLRRIDPCRSSAIGDVTFNIIAEATISGETLARLRKSGNADKL